MGIKHEWEPNLHLVPIPLIRYRSLQQAPSYGYDGWKTGPKPCDPLRCPTNRTTCIAVVHRQCIMLNCLQLSPRFQVPYGFRFESPFMPVTAVGVFQFTVRSEDRENSINTSLTVHMTHVQATGLPRRLMINHLKNGVAFYRSLGKTKCISFITWLQGILR